MSEIHNLSQAQINLVHTSNELVALINRVNQLESAQKKYELKNAQTIKRMNEVILLKKKAQEDMDKQLKAQNDKMVEQQRKHANVQQVRNELNEDRALMLQAIQELRSQDYIATKQQSLKAELKMKEFKEQEIERRRQQAEKVQQWRIQQKESMQRFWEQKFGILKYQQDQTKEKVLFQAQMQERAIVALEQMENDLLEKLKNTQNQGKILTQQLEQTMIKPSQELLEIVEKEQATQLTKKSEDIWTKRLAMSPYIQIPMIPRHNRQYKEVPMPEEISPVESQVKLTNVMSLPGLLKPSFRDQQMQVERLHNSKKELNIKLEELRKKDLERQLGRPVKDLNPPEQRQDGKKLQFKKKKVQSNHDTESLNKNTTHDYRKSEDMENENYDQNKDEYEEDYENDHEFEEPKNKDPQQPPANDEDEYGEDQFDDEGEQTKQESSPQPKPKPSESKAQPVHSDDDYKDDGFEEGDGDMDEEVIADDLD